MIFKRLPPFFRIFAYDLQRETAATIENPIGSASEPI
jgi:hypothetical protein